MNSTMDDLSVNKIGLEVPLSNALIADGVPLSQAVVQLVFPDQGCSCADLKSQRSSTGRTPEHSQA